MGERRGYGDELWRLARGGAARELERAAELLLADGDASYEGHRARAFALAVEGRADDALAELNRGWDDEWPFPAAYAADVGRVRFLAGDYEQALTALRLAVRGAEHVDDAVQELAQLCVERQPRLWRPALAIALSGGSPVERGRAARRLVRARLGG